MRQIAKPVTFAGAETKAVIFGPFSVGTQIHTVMVTSLSGGPVNITGRVGVVTNNKTALGTTGGVSSPTPVPIGSFDGTRSFSLPISEVIGVARYLVVELTSTGALSAAVWIGCRGNGNGLGGDADGSGGGGVVPV